MMTLAESVLEDLQRKFQEHDLELRTNYLANGDVKLTLMFNRGLITVKDDAGHPLSWRGRGLRGALIALLEDFNQPTEPETSNAQN